MSDHIQSDVNNGLLTITINRSEKKNALTSAMYQKMVTLVREAATDEKIGVILFTGGTDFCAGNDLKDFLESPSLTMEAPAIQFMQAISEYPLPIIAAVDGFAVGIGTTFLFNCDFVYATPRTLFTLPFVNLGLVPEFGVSQTLPMMAGYQKAAELLMLGENFDAETAKQLGIVNQICEPDQVLATAQATAKKLLAKPHGALRKTKELIRREPETMLERFKFEAMLLSECLVSDEARAAIAGLLKK